MADEPSPASQIPQLAEVSTALAPIIYFDTVPNFGFNGGICSLALEAITYVRVADTIRIERRVVAHLRMTPAGYDLLKGALEGIKLSATPTPSETVN